MRRAAIVLMGVVAVALGLETLPGVVWVARARAEAIAPVGSGEDPGELEATLAATGDLERGRLSFATCAVCHGSDGGGRPDGTFPQLAGQHATVIAKQLTDIRAGRRENPLMLPYAKRLVGPQEIADLSLYVSGLPRTGGNGRGDGQQLELGEAIYRRDCSPCHGARASGDSERFIPSLAGQHYGYVLRQIRDIGAGRRHNAHPAMVVLTGRYPDLEFRAVADYVSRIELERPADAAREARVVEVVEVGGEEEPQ